MNKTILKTLSSIMLFMSFYWLTCSVGLENFGNTCYMNATLQCLFACQALSNILDNNPALLKNKPVLVSYYSLLKEHQSIQSGKIVPEPFFACIKDNYFFDNPNQQQDAAEFLSAFLGRISEFDFDRDTFKKLKSDKISDLFYFDVNLDLYCIDGTINKKADWFNILTLDFPSDLTKEINFNTLFNKFTQKEDFEVSERPKCSHDETKKVLSNKQSFVSAPRVLIVHPKRFLTQGKWPNFTTKKISNSIVYDLSPLSLATNNGSFDYRLFACVIHIGTTPNSGHYVAIVRYGQQWFFCNDTSVTKITPQEAINYAQGGLREQGYIYFFEREDKALQKQPDNRNNLNNLFNDFMKKASALFVNLKYFNSIKS
jgi:ubiquitin C-terminal hydrolase